MNDRAYNLLIAAVAINALALLLLHYTVGSAPFNMALAILLDALLLIEYVARMRRPS